MLTAQHRVMMVDVPESLHYVIMQRLEILGTYVPCLVYDNHYNIGSDVLDQ